MLQYVECYQPWHKFPMFLLVITNDWYNSDSTTMMSTASTTPTTPPSTTTTITTTTTTRATTTSRFLPTTTNFRPTTITTQMPSTTTQMASTTTSRILTNDEVCVTTPTFFSSHKAGGVYLANATDVNACFKACYIRKEMGCKGFDFDTRFNTCWLHSDITECYPLITKPGCAHYRLIHCGRWQLLFSVHDYYSIHSIYPNSSSNINIHPKDTAHSCVKYVLQTYRKVKFKVGHNDFWSYICLNRLVVVSRKGPYFWTLVTPNDL